MRFIRLIGNIALWLGAALGLVAGSLYLAGVLGWAQPLIVISGSMEPGIHTGDLLVATRANSADLEVGDVVSLPSDLTQKLVTHRITEIEPADDGGWKIYMKGDANEFEDIAPYYVGDEVWQPALQIPHVGFAVSKLMQPSVSLPIVIALGALLGMSLLDGGKRPDDEDELDEALADDSTDELDRPDPLVSIDAAGDTDQYDMLFRPANIPVPVVGATLLLEPSFAESSRVQARDSDTTSAKPSLSDRDALAEIDAALAAFGIHVDAVADPHLDVDATTQLDRDLFDLVMSG